MSLALLAPTAPAHPYGEIAAVTPGSAAERAGLIPGDAIVSVNGHRLRDVIDFRFYTADDELAVKVRRGEEQRTVRLVHGPEDPLGIELRGDGLELIAECNNHCPFCFVTQLPPGMRRTLSIKDDDYRYSFLFASFVTMSNLAQLAGHCVVDDHVTIGGMAGFHQFVRVGRYAFVGGASKVRRDIPPYFLVEGDPAVPYGLNSVGLRRASFSEEDRAEIKKFYKLLNGSKLRLAEAIEVMKEQAATDSGRHMLEFLEAESQRGVLLK